MKIETKSRVAIGRLYSCSNELSISSRSIFFLSLTLIAERDTQELDKNNEARAVALCISKTFDKFWYSSKIKGL